MLLGDKTRGMLCGNLEEAANDYQASTSAVRLLERIEGGVHTAVKMTPLKALGPRVIERRAWRYFLQTSHTKTYTYIYNEVWCSKEH